MTDEQRRQFADNIDADAARMQRMVMRLLQLAQIENAPEPTESIDVADFFAALRNRYPDIKFGLQSPPARIAISGEHLRSAVVNLIENAVRHGQGKPVSVRVSAEQERLRIEVEDQGPGISPANQPRLFQRFFTTQRDSGGTGLGLAIVRAVAERHGGAVSYRTSPSGTTFTLLLSVSR